MEKKLRLQLFDQEARLVEDRMVSQDPEMYSGPKNAWDGSIRVEFTLENKDDVPKVKEYLDRLTGVLPLNSIKKKKLLKVVIDPSEREDVLAQALENADDQDQLITYLRSLGFKFMMYDFVHTLELNQLTIKDRHQEKYQWMMMLNKPAKNPKSDKYDPMLVFGIQLLPWHDEKIVVYLNGEYHKSFKVPVPAKPKEVFKKTEMMKFPPYMTHPERDKFRYELRQLQLDPEKSITKFFARWQEWVENCPAISQDKKVQDGE